MTKRLEPSEKKPHYRTKVGPLRELMIFDTIGKHGKTATQLVLDTNISRSQMNVYLMRMMGKGMLYVAPDFARPKGRGPNLPVYMQRNRPSICQDESMPVIEPPKPKAPMFASASCLPQNWCSALFEPSPGRYFF